MTILFILALATYLIGTFVLTKRVEKLEEHVRQLRAVVSSLNSACVAPLQVKAGIIRKLSERSHTRTTVLERVVVEQRGKIEGLEAILKLKLKGCCDDCFVVTEPQKENTILKAKIEELEKKLNAPCKTCKGSKETTTKGYGQIIDHKSLCTDCQEDT